MFNNTELFLIIFLVSAGGIVVLINMAFIYLSKKTNPVFNYRTQMKEVVENKKRPNHKFMEGTFIGYNYQTPVCILDNAKHVFICGTTGSGKTVALSNFICRAHEKQYPALIVDGKGDINEGSILDFCKKLPNRKQYIINLTNPELSDKYNPFKNTSPTICKDMLINLTNWSEEHYKLNTERYLQRVINLINLKGLPLSFKSIIEYIPVDKFVMLSMELTKNNLLSKEAHLNNVELSKISGKISESAAARFSLLLESELGTIFHEDGIDIVTALKEHATIIFVLNPLLYPETSSLMGRLITIDSKKAVGKLYENKKRIFFMFDEISTYASNNFIDLVNKSRSANVTCILATQSLSDLDYAVNEDFKEQIIENCNHYLVLRQNSAKNSETWANIIGTQTGADTTYQLSDEMGYTAPTGKSTIQFNREYIFHPDEIKNLKQGEAFYISKDNGVKIQVKIYKPF